MQKLKKLRQFFSIVLAVFMFFGMMNHPVQVQAETNTDTYVNELISYYKNYQEKAETDIERVLGEMKSVDEAAYDDWKEIMDYWDFVNTDMTVNLGVAPDGLPEDDSLAIVVLGFALNDDGTMKDELIGRLQVGLASAEKYPNSYIVCTGGGTAKNNPEVTEGGLMGEWLIEQGLDENRVIVENKAPTTVGNALNTYNILVQDYPQVESVCLITSDYHVPRGCLLFNSKFILAATEAGTKPLNIVANAGYKTGTNGYESISLQASGVASVAGISLSGNVSLSVLSYLDVALNEAYVSGNDLDISVTAGYDSGYEKDVTDKAVISGFDALQGDEQTITISYTENDMTVSGNFTLSDMSKQIAATAPLETLIQSAKDIDGSKYSSETVKALNAAVEAAEELLDSGNYTVEDLAAAYEKIQKAYDDLLAVVNAAYKKNVTASSNQDEAYKLVNGSKKDYWTSKDSNGEIAVEDSYFVIDLDGEYELSYIQVVPYYGNERYYHYDIQVSTDGENWETAAEHRSTEACTESGNIHKLDAETRARYVKVVGVAAYCPDEELVGFHVKEVSVYGIEKDNIALGKNVVSSGTDTSASSSAGSNEKKIVDGDRTSYWDGGKYKSRPWAIIDLGAYYKLDRVNVINYWNGSQRYYQYEVYTSVDGENYILLGEKTDTAIATMAGETYQCTETIYAKYIKIVGTYNSKNSAFHINEVRAYGELTSDENYKEYEYTTAKNALNSLVQEYESAYDKTEYTESTWNIFEEALDDAKELLENTDTQAADFYKMIERLKTVAEQLEYAVVEKPEGAYRLASFNLGAKYGTDAEPILKNLFKRYSVDYVGLQEVDRNTTRNNYDVIGTFVEENGAFTDLAFQKTLDYQNGQYGIGIVSSTKIKSTEGGLLKVLGSEEQRGWVKAVIEIDGKEVAFYDTHLSLSSEANRANMAELIEIMANDPTEYKILTGDFNCNREWMYPFLVDYNLANGKDGLWFATSADSYSDVPSSDAYGLDNIITSRNINVLDFKVVKSNGLSDHNFIYIDFELLDEEVPSKEYLNIEIADAAKLDKSDYTEGSYAVLESALKEAAELPEKATQKEINTVLFKIQNAVEDLERIHPLISNGKSVIVNGTISGGKAENVTDGNVLSYLQTKYSDEIIVDLEDVYQIDEIQVFPYGVAPRYIYYTLYTSIDGVDYEYFGEKNTNEIANIKNGDVFEKENCSAQYVMIKMTYNSTSDTYVYLSELEVYGSPAEQEETFEITKQPENVAAANGKDASVTVEATGKDLTYIWYYKNPGNAKFYVSGSTFAEGNTYTIPMNAWRDGQQVYCVITDAEGNTLTSDTVTLSLTKAAVTITKQPVDVSVENGEAAVVTVEAVGENLTYTWYYKNPGNAKFYVSGSTYAEGSTYSIPMNAWRDGQQVYCVITDAEGNAVQTETVTLSLEK